ncbi:VOC family protein [Actinocatenispora sera]|uniref:VOC family protein n=1 Tax=Actinocatenispora sera TaxID=390989 RepID=UPI0033C11FDD
MGHIIGVHTLVYADDPEAARAFFRDVLEWPYVDAHGGWLIFGTGPSELGVHPTREDGSQPQPLHEVTLMCDDIEQAVADLTARGARFTQQVETESFGRTARVAVPGAGDMLLYQPTHPTAYQR